MPRFNQKRWKPSDDSSPGMSTIDPSRIVLNIAESGEEVGCPCGCGLFPKGRGARFAMGHDARLRGKLIRAYLTGTEIRVLVNGDTNGGPPYGALEMAEEYGWTEHLEAAAERREGRNRDVLQRALGSTRLVQVGRWEYTGQVAAVYRVDGEDMYEIEYVTRSGDIKKARVPAAEAMEVRS